ncbi:alpha/beta hydrolase family protein [Erythrobacter donghaensis]|jgi:dipeptidyl aminopeptidase/acylaminoacyl peptidase|uniref:S9 family peptidase n=1 Tax=Erythrobacter donghaensis TaxID=267135 RepID=UPI00093B0195|nr:S9 family peptidase [Erythrobacter donghaensis]
MRSMIATFLLLSAAPLAAQIATPERPVTDPKSLQSPVNPQAREVPLEDIGNSRGVGGVTWSADGKHIFIVTNLTGRFNIWRTDANGSWPLQMTQSDESQGGLAASRDGKWLYFRQDAGGDEYYDIYRVPTTGGATQRITNTPDLSETGMVPGGADGLIALSVKKKSEAQSNLAVLAPDGSVRVLTAETDPDFGWSARVWADDGRTIYANREKIDSTTTEIWRVDVATGKATRVLAKDKTIYALADISPDGKWIAVTTDVDTGRPHAGLYDLASGAWKWLQPIPWDQSALRFTRDGKALLVESSDDLRSKLVRVDLASGTESPLKLPQGINFTSGLEPRSPDGKSLLVVNMAANVSGELNRYDLADDSVRPITQLALASLRPEALAGSQMVTYKSFDGTLISALVTMPANLKRDGSNPAIVIPHGGPTGKTDDFFDDVAAALASRGYVIIAPNFRGSTGYGKAFQAANYDDLGGGDLKDTIAAKQFLVDSGYVDPKRVGIFGGSYGGFMTLMAIGKAPDEFAAGVQWFGIINWRTMYRDMDEVLKAYLRSLMGTPEANPEGYDRASPLTYIANAKAPLLTIQGENDIRVPRGQAQEVEDILKAKGRTVETVFYPLEGHGFRKRENQLDSLKRTVEWFDRHLKPQMAK